MVCPQAKNPSYAPNNPPSQTLFNDNDVTLMMSMNNTVRSSLKLDYNMIM